MVKQFIIFHHPTQGYQAVKAGFCWPAFLFTFWWMLFSKMWGHAAVFLAIHAGIQWMIHPADTLSGLLGLTAVCYLPIMFFCGYGGNKWRLRNLKSRGYKQVGIAYAVNNADAAIASHIRKKGD